MKMDFDLCNLFEEVDDHSNGLEYMETLDQPFAEHSSQQHLPTLSSSPVFDRQEGTNWLSFEDDLALYSANNLSENTSPELLSFEFETIEILEQKNSQPAFASGTMNQPIYHEIDENDLGGFLKFGSVDLTVLNQPEVASGMFGSNDSIQAFEQSQHQALSEYNRSSTAASAASRSLSNDAGRQNGAKKRATIRTEQKMILCNAYKRCRYPNREERAVLGMRTYLNPRQVQIWFQNARRLDKQSGDLVNHKVGRVKKPRKEQEKMSRQNQDHNEDSNVPTPNVSFDMAKLTFSYEDAEI